jgi:hypothetical protein
MKKKKKKKKKKMMMMIVIFVVCVVIGHRWNEIEGKTTYSEKNLSQCHFFHHKFHMD